MKSEVDPATHSNHTLKASIRGTCEGEANHFHQPIGWSLLFLFSYSPDQLEACRSVRVNGLNRELLKQGTLPVTRLSILFHCKWLLSHLLAPGPFVFSWPCPFMLLGQTCAANALCCFYSLIGASSCCLAEPRSTERALWHAGFTPTARSSVSTSPSVY